MLVDKNNRKRLIDFLINRWRMIIGCAAAERVCIASLAFAKTNNLPTPQTPTIVIPKPCRQIEIIKQRIIEILPETKFIDYTFELPAPLDPKDFVEIYLADHEMCMSKVEEVVEKMQIT